MGEGGFEGDAALGVAGFTSAVDDLLGLPLTSLPGVALVEVAHLVETQLRRMAAFDHSLVAALIGSAVYADLGARSTAALLSEALRLSPTEASARVRAATELGPRVDFTGAPMPALYPHVAAGQLSGELVPRARAGDHRCDPRSAHRGPGRARRAAGDVPRRPRR